MTVTAEQQQRAAAGSEGKQASSQKHALLQRQRCGGRRGLESRVNLAQRLDGMEAAAKKFQNSVGRCVQSRMQSSRQCVTT